MFTQGKTIFVGCAAILLSIAACATDQPPPSKEDFRALDKADLGFDVCEEFGWYGDGVCDEFCWMPDPDCESAELLCPNPNDPSVHYFGNSDESASVCLTGLFACEENQELFSDECGCGCIDL